jgi:hypothetical protein
MNMVNFVQVRQAKCILAHDDVRAYSIPALCSSEFTERNLTTARLIQYDELFDELKMPLV